MHLTSLLLGPIAFAGLLVLPGTWITFCVPGSDLAFWPRLWIGAALSPFVVLLEYYAVRLTGAPFALTARILFVINLPAAYAVARAAHGAGMLAPVARARVAAVATACVAWFAVYYGHRSTFGHSWMHADIVYQLVNGGLRPEDPELAGVALAYPWFGHIQHAVFSWVMSASSLDTYMWPNIAYLVFTLSLTWCIAQALSDDHHAKVWSLMLLLFAVNVVGYTLARVVPAQLLHEFPGIAGYQYTPWVRRFLSFEQEQAVLPMFSAILLLAVDRPRGDWSLHRLLLGMLLLSGLGVIYPIVLPAALSVLAAIVIVQVIIPGMPRARVLGRVLPLGGIAIVAVGVTYAAVTWVTTDTHGGVGVGLDQRMEMIRKAIEIAVVMSPLLLGGAIALRDRVPLQRESRLIVALTGAQCVLLYIVFQISQGSGNEYKYVFVAAAAFAPLAALAVSRTMVRLGRASTPITLAALLVLSAPGFHRWWTTERRAKAQIEVEVASFDVHLRTGRYAGATDALRARTPLNTMLVVRKPSVHLPTLTQRSLYAPYADEHLAGTNLAGDRMLLNVKGYWPSLLVARRVVLRDLFAPDAPTERQTALARLEAMDRPIAVVVEESRDAGLSTFLQSTANSTRIYGGEGLTVWLLGRPHPMVASVLKD